MTSGSSQGLFVIVAVVIFGIFVVISYLLFRDKLQTGLASIFDDSISETSKYLVSGVNFLKEFNSVDYKSYNPSKEGLIKYTIENDKNILNVDTTSVTSGLSTKAGVYYSVNGSDFKKGDTITISVYAKGTGKLYFGLEGFSRLGSLQYKPLTSEYQKYELSFVSDIDLKDNESDYKAIIFYTSGSTNMYLYSPEYKIIRR